MSQSSPPSWRKDLLTLFDPPLLVAVAGETLAGAYLAGLSFNSLAPYVLAVASSLIFAAGGLFAGYFERAALAAREPQHQALECRTLAEVAWKLGWALLLVGAALPALFGRATMLASVILALLVVVYAAVTREIWGLGFLTTGAARGANLLLGISANAEAIGQFAPAALPVGLLAVTLAVTRHARQPGAPPTTGFVALVHGAAAVAVLCYLAANTFFYRVDALPFLFAAIVFALPRLVKAVQDPGRLPAVEALQFGTLSLTLLAATLAAGYAGVQAGVLIALFCVPLYAALRYWPVSLVTSPR
jgi:hypothetical protein